VSSGERVISSRVPCAIWPLATHDSSGERIEISVQENIHQISTNQLAYILRLTISLTSSKVRQSEVNLVSSGQIRTDLVAVAVRRQYIKRK